VSAAQYFLQEASLSLWRRRRASVLSILTIVTAMFVLGLFLLLNVNLQRWLGRWTQAAEFSVYLADGLGAAERDAIARQIGSAPLVAAHEYVSEDEALRRFARTFPELAQAARTLGERPLPASFEVRLRPEAAASDDTEQFAARMRQAAGVADVRYDRQWLERVTSFVRAGRIAGLALAGVLVLAAALTVASVVRLAMHARQQEVEIMQLVGAPIAYIRGPFVLEGVIQGGLGASIALALLFAAYLTVRGSTSVLGAAGTLDAVFLPWPWALALIAGGMGVGCLGGTVAARSAR
jgi:cell division transport system permease protein